MAISCTAEHTLRPREAPPGPAPVGTLRDVVKSYGTPAYAYDLGRIRAQVDKLRTHLPPEVEILYSLKANSSLGLCSVLAESGLGADVASAGELVTACAAGFPSDRIFLTGPDKSPAVLAELRSLAEVVLSLDSVSELQLLAGSAGPRRALLRLRPDFSSYASCAAGPDSRFGLTMDDLPRCRPYLTSSPLRIIGFHVFSGSQVTTVEGIIHHLRGGLDLSLRAAETLGVNPQIIDLGGGFGIPYGPGDRELDLDPIGAEMRSLLERAAPARLVVELGRYLVAQAGWYLTSVLGEQTHHGRKAVVVDGGSHQRGDMCGVGLRHKAFAPVVLHGRHDELVPTDVLGCLSLPSDVLAEAALLPPLSRGDVLAFPNAGAYGLGASPVLFHAHVAPAEVAFDGDKLSPLRLRPPPRAILEGQIPMR